MRAFVLALLLLMPFTVSAQYEAVPRQQTAWMLMTATAPIYLMLVMCERDITAYRLLEDTQTQIGKLVQSESEWDIVSDMWDLARSQSQAETSDRLIELGKQPESEACDALENRVIKILGIGI